MMQVPSLQEHQQLVARVNKLEHKVSVAHAAACLPEYMTRAEVARAVRLSLRQVDRLIANGEICHVKLGRSVKIKTASVAQYMLLSGTYQETLEDILTQAFRR